MGYHQYDTIETWYLVNKINLCIMTNFFFFLANEGTYVDVRPLESNLQLHGWGISALTTWASSFSHYDYNFNNDI